MDTPTGQVTTSPSQNKEVNNHAVMGVLSYIGILVIIPFLMSKNVPFVKFHIKQGLVLLIIEIIVWVVSAMFGGLLWFILELVNLALLILSIIGIVNVLQNKEAELPLVGHFAKNINI